MSVQLDDPIRRGIDAQVSALGSVLLQPELIPRLLSELRETDFDGAFRELYTAIRELYHRGAPLDPVTLTDQAGQQHRELILQILELTPSAANFSAYAEIVRKEARIQSVRSLAAELRTAASLEDMQALHDRIGDLLAGSSRRTVMTMADLMADFVLRKTEGENYITTGMSCLDGWIYLSPGDLTVIAGQPSRGKTALALQMAVNQSRERRVGFYSLETSAGKVADRLVTMYSGVSFGSIKRAKLDPGEWDAVGQATSHLAGDGGYQLEVIEAAGMTVDEIFAVASSQPGKVGKYYLYGLMLTPWIGWSLGTFLGAAAGTLLPAFVRTALGIAIYGMFLAIILPPARKSRPVRFVVLVAVGLSLCFRYIPGLNTVSSGFVIIICGVLAAAAGAWRFPAEEDAA